MANDKIVVELTAEEWNQVMVILQGGVYRVVAPLLQKISQQFVPQPAFRIVREEEAE